MIRKSILPLLFLLTLSGFTFQGSPIEGLTVEFRKISHDYLLPANIYLLSSVVPNSSVIEAHEGMKFVKLKVTFRNDGNKICKFRLYDIYLSTEQDSLYALHSYQGQLTSNETKIKPTKEIKRVLYFEFPDKATPKELFIEDKRYKVEVIKEEADEKATKIEYEEKD